MVSPERAAGIGSDQRETLPKIVVQEICRNIQVVEVNGEREYQITWKAGTEGVAGAKKGKPAVCHFETAQQVINQHERVLERYLGVEIPLAAGKLR